MKLFTLFFISTLTLGSTAMGGSYSKLSLAVEKSDIFFWGETHDIKAQSLTFQKFLDESAAEVFDVVATETVFKEDDPIFQTYLDDKFALPNSAGELKFFKAMRATGYGWIKTLEGQDTYRAWWKLKQKKPSIKICGIDRRTRQNSPASYPQKVWDELPEALRKFISTVSKLPQNELRDGESNHFREAGMAYAMAECLEARGRALIHVGAYHAVSPSKYPTQQTWRSASVYLDFLNSSPKKITTLYDTRNTGEKQDKVGNAFIQVFSILKGRNEALLTAADLGKLALQNTLTLDQSDGSHQSLLLWDLFIIGPVAESSTPSPLNDDQTRKTK